MYNSKSILADCFHKDLRTDTPRRVYSGYGKIIQSSANQTAQPDAPIPPQAV